MPPKSNQKTYKECTKIEKNNTNRDINILSHILNYKYTFYTTAAINYQFAGCDVIGYPNAPNISKLLYIDIKTSNQVKRNKFYFELYEEKILIDKNGNKQGQGKYKSWCFKDLPNLEDYQIAFLNKEQAVIINRKIMQEVLEILARTERKRIKRKEEVDKNGNPVWKYLIILNYNDFPMQMMKPKLFIKDKKGIWYKYNK